MKQEGYNSATYQRIALVGDADSVTNNNKKTSLLKNLLFTSILLTY